MKDIVLYHGSKGGIKGNIQPSSRELCDFGKGFYLGENPEQAKSIISEHNSPYFYKIRLKLSEISEDRILKLDGDDWLYSVLACRNKIPEFNNLSFIQELIDKINSSDVVIGKIADDKMSDAINQYTNGALSNLGLYNCLRSVQYGDQYVLKTPFACSKTEILDERKLSSFDIANIQKYNSLRRSEATKAIFNSIVKYRGQGVYFDELLVKYSEKQPLNKNLDNGLGDGGRL